MVHSLIRANGGMRKSKPKYVIGIDKVGRAAPKGRASRLAGAKAKRTPRKYVIGIDEVGRGALAGPVVVAAVCFPTKLRVRNAELGALKDSKKLSPKARERWLEHFKTVPEILSRTARVYPRKIEKINISQAANRAATSALERVIESVFASRTKKHSNILQNVRMFKSMPGTNYSNILKNIRIDIFLDGGLYLTNKINPSINFLRHGSRQAGRMIVKTIIRGDEKIAAIKIASIIAKVQRDKYMKKLSRKYPRYDFEMHKGYGTKMHRRAIRKHGPSEVHRLTFLKKSHRIANSK